VLNPASYIDHTLLKPETTPGDIAVLCEEAVEYGFASVCVPPRFVGQAAEILYGSGVRTGTVVGFPLGYETSAIKAEQAAHAVRSGAEEIDMVIPLGAARLGNYEEVVDDIRAVVERAEGRTVKVILECCLFDDAAKRMLVEAVVAGGADYVKTSTGFAAGGAVLEDVRLLSEVAAERLKVKAAGGIRDWSSCRSFIEAGAARVGTSAGVAIMKQWMHHAI
jgi:deoxyribose-phosphate aldolase